jgi:hypothetical protein
MLRFASVPTLRRIVAAPAAAVVALLPAVAALCTPLRTFDTRDSTVDERGPFDRLQNITPIVGQPKPCTRDGDWQLRFHLRDKMSVVLCTILREEGWAEPEIKRELENFHAHQFAQIRVNYDNRSRWDTVEDFQRTPWYRRWRPNTSSSFPMVSVECMKLLERALIPPSARADPYVHLRKRHYEDTFHNEKYSEGNVRDLTRERLAKFTQGMPGYGSVSRRDFLEFEKEYRKRQPGQSVALHESYNAWKVSQR